MLFNEMLIRRRKELGLTQDEFADKLDVSRQSISKWENGECMPDSDKLIRLSDVLNISLDELTGRTVSSEPADPAPTVSGSNKRACFFAGRASAANKAQGTYVVQGFGLVAEFDENDDVSSIQPIGPGATSYVEEIVSIDREAIVNEMYKYLIENEPDLSEDKAMSIAAEIVDRFEKIEAEHAKGSEAVLSYYCTQGGAQVFNMGKLIEEVLNDMR